METPRQLKSSPLDGVAVLLRSFGTRRPAWIADVSTRLSAPERARPITLAAIGAGIAAICGARAKKSGPGIACVLLTLVAVLVQTMADLRGASVGTPGSKITRHAWSAVLPTTSIRLFSPLQWVTTCREVHHVPGQYI